jgi:hypothetical protein
MVATPYARAMEWQPSPDLKLVWDNTVKYSTALRLGPRKATLVANPNADDGDRNFDQWRLTSVRLDLLSEVDVTYRNFGVRASGAGWYDLIYNLDNDNDSPATWNALSVPNNEFPHATRNLHGRRAELLDALVFANGRLGGMEVNLRVGRHTLLWGESLLIADNGIFYAQAPLDIIKALSVPGSQAKELFMPVAQASTLLRPTASLSLAAFCQFEFRRTRLPGVGSYFSTTDVLVAGGERLFVMMPPGFGLFRSQDLTARHWGQWGVSVRYRAEAADLDAGLYFINFHEKLPFLYLYPGRAPDPAQRKAGEYALVYPEDIQLVGASVTTALAEALSLAGEVHVRLGTPLASTPQVIMPGVVADNDDNPRYAVGHTLHALVSGIYSFGPRALWQAATLAAEVGWQRRTTIRKNRAALDPTREQQAYGMRLLFTPSYYQVLPNLDLSVPTTLTYNPRGKSPLPAFNGGAHNGGIASVGLAGEYRRVWLASIQASYFFGTEQFQMRRDRHFASISIQRTF